VDPPRGMRDTDAQAPVSIARSRATYFDGELPILPGIRLPLRSMLVESPTDAILVSPVGTPAETRAVGRTPVTLVAPSLLHHKFLGDAIARTGPRDVWGPAGLADKRPELARAAPGGLRVFGKHPWPYDDKLSYCVVAGAPHRSEVVFFHRASGTLYTADLVFAIGEPEGMLAPLAFRAMGIYKRFAVSKMWKRWVEDRAAFKRSIERILAWDFDRLAMAHGDIVLHGARPKLVAALRERDLF
jgi:hypothetical protein